MDMHKRMRSNIRRPRELDGGSAFVPDHRHGFVELDDGDAEAFGEEFIASALSGESVGEDARDEADGEELAGIVVPPFDDDVLVEN